MKFFMLDLFAQHRRWSVKAP